MAVTASFQLFGRAVAAAVLVVAVGAGLTSARADDMGVGALRMGAPSSAESGRDAATGVRRVKAHVRHRRLNMHALPAAAFGDWDGVAEVAAGAAVPTPAH
jgi:hypothetical protein